MMLRVAVPGLLCLFTACQVSPSFEPTSGPELRSDASHRSDAASLPASRAPLATPPQYAPRALFMKEHGDFILGYQPWRPDVETSVFNMSDAEVKSEAGQFDLVTVRGRAEGNIYVDPHSYLHIGLNASLRDYQFSTTRGTGANDNQLYRAEAALGFGHFLTSEGDMLLEANFRPGIYSDFNGTLHRQDFQFFFDAMMSWRIDENIYLKGGVERSALFRDLDAFPLLGLSMKLDDMFRFDVLLPKTARFTMDLSGDGSETTAVNVSLDLRGEEYRIRDVPNNSGTQRTINVQELELSLGGYHRLGGENQGFSFHGRVGTTILGDYHWRDNSANRYDGTLEPQLFVEIGFGIDF